MSKSDGQGQQAGTFHTPSFGDEDFDLPPLTIPTDPEAVNTGGNAAAQQPFSHQMLANLDLGLNQGFNSSSMQTADSAPLVSMRGMNPIAPKFPPQNFEVPDINVTNSLMSSSTSADNIFSSIAATAGNLFGSSSITERLPVSSTGTLSTISQSQMANQLGFQTALPSTSPPESNSTPSPNRDSSEDSDDLPLAQLMSQKRATSTSAAAPTYNAPTSPAAVEAPVAPVIISTSATASTTAAKKQKTPKKKKKKDPNEPQKPVSAYALFFRDTQAAIKGQSPNKSFGDVSKIVASMWDSLDPDNKNVYKKKTEVAKKEYLKQLAAYRASQVSQGAVDEVNAREKSPSPPMDVSMSTMHSGGNSSVSMMRGMSRMNMPSPPQQQQQQPAPMLTNTYNSPPHQPMQQIQNLGHQSALPPLQNNGIVYQRSPDYSQNLNPMDNSLPNNGLCVRNGCSNQAIDNPGWDSEYCSNECVVSHCRDIFTAWVAAKQGGSTFQVK